MKYTEAQFNSLLKTLTEIGIALSAEKDHARLLELILSKAQEITNADGGTIYTCMNNTHLKHEIMMNKSMKTHLGGTSRNQVTVPDLPLYDSQGNPNNQMLAARAVLTRKTSNIKDAYNHKGFDFSGTKMIDKKAGYYSKSLLTVPMMNHLNQVIGVLQLINAVSKKTKAIIPFSKLDQHLIESMASQAAVTITNRELIDAEKELFDALIQLIAKAIDEKSHYTGGHCRRVPVIARMLALATCQIDKGPLKDFNMTEDELYELEVAAWLHDCGKITTPESVVDKATKLEGIIDGIKLVDIRIEVLKRDAIIKVLQDKLAQITGAELNLTKEKALQELILQLNRDREIIHNNNLGGERIEPEQLKLMKEIASQRLTGPSGYEEPLLSDKEVQLLGIPKGTLSLEERGIINNHVSVTIKMLESLPYPDKLKHIPSLAGSHHEKMDGSGYPRGLTKDQMPLQARMLGIADVFEALTACDRPYKKAMPLSQALEILGQMKVDGHIDPDLFDVFMHAKIYEEYAKAYLDKKAVALLKQLDLNKIPGYSAL